MRSGYFYADENWSPVSGPEAEELVKARNDAHFLSDDSGVIRVSRERWEQASAAERNGWLTLWTKAKTDRNETHSHMFDGYSELRKYHFQSAIELGCGPFTNLATMGDILSIGECHLLDPLVNDYVSHEHCRYKTGKLVTASGKEIPVANRYGVPIEDVQSLSRFPLVVMINVIEHCIDAERIFEVISTMAQGTFFVFHDKLYKHDEVAEAASRIFDIGHPLKVDGKYLTSKLRSLFDPVFWRTVQTSGRQDEIYMIGRRL